MRLATVITLILLIAQVQAGLLGDIFGGGDQNNGDHNNPAPSSSPSQPNSAQPSNHPQQPSNSVSNVQPSASVTASNNQESSQSTTHPKPTANSRPSPSDNNDVNHSPDATESQTSDNTSTSTGDSTQQHQQHKGPGGISTTVIIIASVGGFVIVVGSALALILCAKRRRRRCKNDRLSAQEMHNFPYESNPSPVMINEKETNRYNSSPHVSPPAIHTSPPANEYTYNDAYYAPPMQPSSTVYPTYDSNQHYYQQAAPPVYASPNAYEDVHRPNAYDDQQGYPYSHQQPMHRW